MSASDSVMFDVIETDEPGRFISKESAGLQSIGLSGERMSCIADIGKAAKRCTFQNVNEDKKATLSILDGDSEGRPIWNSYTIAVRNNQAHFYFYSDLIVLDFLPVTS